jgi:hypothetical protein
VIDPWDPRDYPNFTIADLVRAVPAFVVLVVMFVAIVYGIPVFAAAVSGARP